jgi:hypothetical protein
MSKKPAVLQKHHLCYQPEIIVPIRKGCHQTCTLIQRYSFLTDQEIYAIKMAAEMKRQFETEKGEL